MFWGKKALLLALVFSFPEMATVKNKLLCFPLLFPLHFFFLLVKCTYPVSWTARIPALSWPSPGCSWSGPIQTPGKRQNRKWLYMGETSEKQHLACGPLSLSFSLGTSRQAWHLPHLIITILGWYIFGTVFTSPFKSPNFFILVFAHRLPRLCCSYYDLQITLRPWK